MQWRYLIYLVLALGLTAAAPTFTPTCEVKATYTTQEFTLGRVVTITPAATCPKNGAAYVRFRSRTGTQPDSPPGLFTLHPGDMLTRRVPWDWWVEVRDKGLRWTAITPRKAGD